jgi:hypothetical protein
MDLLDLKIAAKNNPWVFSQRWKFLEKQGLHRRVVRPGDDLVIEGYPRSANTFATYAFEEAQARPIKLGNHFHSPAQFILAARYNVPAMLVIRDPVDAALSFMVFSQCSAREALRRYVAFHEPLSEVRSYFTVAPFEEIITDFDKTITRFNQYFGTQFKLFDHTVDRAAALITRIDNERSARADAHPNLLSNSLGKSTPSAEKYAARVKIRFEIEAAELSPLLSKAQGLYHRLAG